MAKRITVLMAQGARFVPIVGSTLLALCMILQPSLAQKEILSGRGPVALTPAQQAVVDKITRSPETLHCGVIRKTDIKESGPPENRYARMILPLGDGKEIALIRTRNTVKTERGFTWRGVTERPGTSHTHGVERRAPLRLFCLQGPRFQRQPHGR